MNKLMSTWQQLRVFYAFFKRDCIVQLDNIKNYIINFVFCYPILFAVCFGYIQSRVLFGPENQTLPTIMFTGSVLIILMIVTFKKNIDIAFDLEQRKIIESKLIVLNPKLILLEQMIFVALVTFFLAAPFFLVAKLLLGSFLNTSNTNWIGLFAMLFIGSFCCSAYHLLACLVIRTSQISSFWARINHVLITFGGFWIPRYVLTSFSPFFATLAYLNPLLYLTEGVRQAMVGGDNYLPLSVCLTALIVFTILFTIFSWYVFKKRIDHI